MAEVTFEHQFAPGDKVCMVEKVEGRDNGLLGLSWQARDHAR